ncbi:MAG: hypothetical protein WC525_05725, partial [Candidatus Thermoplasmatota archaeon]
MKKKRSEKAVAFGIVVIFLFGAITPVISSLSKNAIDEESIHTTIDTLQIEIENEFHYVDEDYSIELEKDINGGFAPLDFPVTFYQTCGYWYRKPSTYAQLITWYKNLEQNFSNYME